MAPPVPPEERETFISEELVIDPYAEMDAAKQSERFATSTTRPTEMHSVPSATVERPLTLAPFTPEGKVVQQREIPRVVGDARRRLLNGLYSRIN